MVSPLNTTPGSPAQIEPATWRDLTTLRRLEQVCFPKDAWPLLDLIGVLTLPNIVRLKASIEAEMVGFVAADIRPSQHMAWIATIAVMPKYRELGIGKTLLQACEERLQMPKVRLNVRASNGSAIGLYRSFGYQHIAVWPAYYQDGEDAQVMEKEL